MPVNVGKMDRLIRLVIGAMLIIAGLTVVQSGTVTAIAIVVGIVLIATSVVKFCPLYRSIGVRTCKS